MAQANPKKETMLYDKLVDHLPLILSFSWGFTIVRTIQALQPHRGKEEALAAALFHIKDLGKYIPFILLAALTLPAAILAGAEPNKAIGVATVIGCACLIQLVLLQRRKAPLLKELREAIIKTSICGMNFSFENCPSIQFWFRETKQEWPKARLEISIDQAPIPVKVIPAATLELLGKVLYPAMKSPSMASVLQEAKSQLMAEGIAHPIDIEGWDQSQLTQDLVEQMFESQPA